MKPLQIWLFLLQQCHHTEEVMLEVHVHGNVWKQIVGSLVWYEGGIVVEEVGGRRRMPRFTFCALPSEDGSYTFVFTEDNVVLHWLYKHEQFRAWSITRFLIEYGKALIAALRDEPSGSNASHSWACSPDSAEEGTMLEDALNCVPVAHSLRPTPETPEA